MATGVVKRGATGVAGMLCREGKAPNETQTVAFLKEITRCPCLQPLKKMWRWLIKQWRDALLCIACHSWVLFGPLTVDLRYGELLRLSRRDTTNSLLVTSASSRTPPVYLCKISRGPGTPDLCSQTTAKGCSRVRETADRAQEGCKKTWKGLRF